MHTLGCEMPYDPRPPRHKVVPPEKIVKPKTMAEFADRRRRGYGSAVLLGIVVQPFKQEQQRAGVNVRARSPLRYPLGVPA